MPPELDPDVEAARLDALGRFVTGSASMWTAYVESLGQRTWNTIAAPNPPSSNYGATPDNVYGSGYFELAGDQAVVIELVPPPCHYWMFQIGNHWFESLDYTYRQTSLNGHQAVLDPEGVFRAVISHDDPGVANWLDTAGNREVPLAYRYQFPTVPFEELPRPTSRVVAFADLERELHPATPRVTSEERADTLARRRRAVLRRYRR